MSGFDPEFDAAGAGTRSGIVPAPGATDGRSNYLRADKTWAVPGSAAPGPEPPAPGPALDQWACNIAGYLTYEVSRLAVKYVVDWLPVSWLGDVAGGIVAGIAGALLPATLLVDGILETAIFDWVSTYVSGHVVDIGTALLDDVAWAKIHCSLYDKIKLTPTNLHTAILALTAALGGLVGWTSPAIAAVGYLFEHLGITDVSGIPVSAFVKQYDCSTCAVTGIGPVKPLLQTSFDLTVTDDVTTGTFIDTVEMLNSAVTVTGTKATIRPEITSQHNTTLVGAESGLDFEDSASAVWVLTDDAANHRVQVSAVVPAATGTTSGINRPDNATIGVSAGVYAVLNGQLATINLDQIGNFSVAASSGTTISSLVIGSTYALQNVGGPFYDSAGTGSPDYSWQVSVDGGSTWQTVLSAPTGSYVVSTPVWAGSSAFTGDHNHARMVFVATTTSIKVRVLDSSYGDNHGTMGWQLLDVVYEGSSPRIDHNGAKVGTRPILDFEDSDSVVATVTDDAANDRVTVSLAATVAGAVINPMTTKGDLIIAATGGTPDRLAVGAANTLLQSVPAATDGVQWVLLGASDIPNLDTAKLTTGTLDQARGGTGRDTSTVNEGDLLVGKSDHSWQIGGIGSGNGISVSELAGIYTIASNLTAGTNITLTVVAGAVRIDATGGGGGGTASLLAISQYAPGSNTNTNYNTTSFVDLDATNAIVTFSAPVSGTVLVRVSGIFFAQGTNNTFVNLREGSSNLANTSRMCTQPGSSTTVQLSLTMYVTGVSAGSHTYKVGIRSDSASGSQQARWGGGPDWGPVIMEVWAV